MAENLRVLGDYSPLPMIWPADRPFRAYIDGHEISGRDIVHRFGTSHRDVGTCSQRRIACRVDRNRFRRCAGHAGDPLDGFPDDSLPQLRSNPQPTADAAVHILWPSARLGAIRRCCRRLLERNPSDVEEDG
jgi:hypothetical protein